MRELVHGSPDPRDSTYMRNRGDRGLLDSLENVSAAAASAPNAGGASIAAHADHLRYGLAFLNRWASGEAEPWKDADWTKSWKKGVVTEAEWRTLRDDLRRETEAWVEALAVPPRRAASGARLDRRKRCPPRVSSRRHTADRSRREGTDGGGREASRGGAEKREVRGSPAPTARRWAVALHAGSPARTRAPSAARSNRLDDARRSAAPPAARSR